MSMTVSVRVAHLAAGRAKGQRHHDTRHRTPAYVDRERTHENSAIIEQPTEAKLRAMCEERRAQRGTKRRMRSDAAIVTSGIITFGKDAQPIIQSLPRDQQDALYRATAEAIAKEWNTDLVSLTVHRDESAPHAHFGLLAVDRSGKPLSKTLDTRRMQDIAGEVYQTLGIQRGTPKQQRIERGEDMAKVVHRSVRQLHQDLPAETEQAQKREAEARAKAEALEAEEQAARARLEALRKDLEDQQAKAEKNRRLIEEQERKLAEGRATEEQAQKRIAIYQKREAEARAKAEALEREAADMEERLQPVREKHPLPEPPKAERVETISKRKLLLPDETWIRDMVPAERVAEYRQKVEWHSRGLMEDLAEARAKADRERIRSRKLDDDLKAVTTDREWMRGILDVIADSPASAKLGEVFHAFGQYLERRQARAKEQSKVQQKGPQR